MTEIRDSDLPCQLFLTCELFRGGVVCVQRASVVVVPSTFMWASIPRCSLLTAYVNASCQKTCHVSSSFEWFMLTAGSTNLSTVALILLFFLEHTTAFCGESMGGSAGPL